MKGLPLLEAKGLAKSFGRRRVLGPLDLDLGIRQRLAIVGPNGAGKTTLLKLLAGVLVPSSGELRWQGVDYRRIPVLERAKRIAYVPQARPANVPLDVEQMVLLGRHPHLGRLQLGWRRADFDAARRALEATGLVGLERRLLSELSGGERQSAFIAAALAQEADLLVLDEPTTHLDPAHQRHVAALVLSLGQGARTVVTATHDLNFASLVADTIVGMRDGRVVASGPPAKVLCREVLQELFAAPFEIVRGGTRPQVVLEIESG